MANKPITNSTEAKVSSSLKSSHIILPIALGLCGIVWLFCSEFETIVNSNIDFSQYFSLYTLFFIAAAFACVALRDLAGMAKIYFLSENKLSFAALFRIRMLYEFTSAVTPSITGGSTLEMLYINKEGIKFGESTAITIISLFLDELALVLFLPLLILSLHLIGVVEAFNEMFAVSGAVSTSIISLFLIGYILKLIWVLILFVGIFVKSSSLVWIIRKIFSLKFLSRWRIGAYRAALDIKTCSIKMQHKSFGFWAKNMVVSFAMWTFRFLIVNMLILAFLPIGETLSSFTSIFDNIIILARQYVMMVVMLIAPTPGGSGFIEIMFKSYLAEFIPQGIVIVLLITAIWRIITFYLYLVAGVIIAPRWIKKNFSKSK